MLASSNGWIVINEFWGKWVAGTGSHPHRQRVSWGWWRRERVSSLCSQDRFSKTISETDMEDAISHWHPGTGGGHEENVYLYWTVHVTKKLGMRGKVHCTQHNKAECYTDGNKLPLPHPGPAHVPAPWGIASRPEKESSPTCSVQHPNCYLVDRREGRHTWVSRIWLRAI